MKRRDGFAVVICLLASALSFALVEFKNSFDAKRFYETTVQPFQRYGFFGKYPEPELLTDMPGIVEEAQRIKRREAFTK
jgi:hypothetical protein